MESIYNNAMRLMQGALYEEAAAEFGRIPDDPRAAEKKAECERLAEEKRLEGIYSSAVTIAGVQTVMSQQKAIGLFEQIASYKDARERIDAANRRIAELREEGEQTRLAAKRRAEEKKLRIRKWKKRGILFAVLAALAVGLYIGGSKLYKTKIAPKLRYERAVKLLNEERYDEAMDLLNGFHYADSDELMRGVVRSRLDAQNTAVGSTVLFGSYEQNNDASDGKEPIEWIVLEKNGSELLLISKYALDAAPYQTVYADGNISWAESDLRRQLNTVFLEEAFNTGEQSFMRFTLIPGKEDLYYRYEPVPDVRDRVFLLSVDEAERYFKTDEARKCRPTDFAVVSGSYLSNAEKTTWWWLRTPGNVSYSLRIACVGTDGTIVRIGHEAGCPNYSVRPVIRIDPGDGSAS